ncbi:MAG: hypothetical protein WD208_11195 [Dehalococcoidia bacterium]
MTSFRNSFVRLTLTAIAVALMAMACGDSGPSVTGHVVDVTPSGIDSFSSLTIRDADGRQWTFEGGRFPHFTPSHLTGHQIAGEQVRITYREEEDGTLVIVEMDDA